MRNIGKGLLLKELREERDRWLKKLEMCRDIRSSTGMAEKAIAEVEEKIGRLERDDRYKGSDREAL